MLGFFVNPIVSHCVALLVGAGTAWYFTHKSMVASFAATVTNFASVIGTDVTKVITDVKKAV